jgi:multiple sugar transport system permease protein
MATTNTPYPRIVTALGPPRARRRPISRVIVRGLGYVALGAAVVTCVIPFYWMLVRATHTDPEMVRWPPPFGLGSSALKNYAYITANFPMWRNFGNSVFVATTHTLLLLFLCSLVAYAFAFYRDAPGRGPLFGFCLATMMIPGTLNIIPYYILMSRLGWINNFLALIVPGAAPAFAIFWLHQFMRYSVPPELLDASKIDGCGPFATYWRIVLPLIGPGLATQGTLTFLGAWNDFLTPLLVMTKKDMYTYTLMIYNVRAYFIPHISDAQFAVVVGTIPILLVFILFSRSFMSGIMTGAIKG